VNIKVNKERDGQDFLSLVGTVAAVVLVLMIGCSKSNRSHAMDKYQTILEPDVGSPVIQVNPSATGEHMKVGNVPAFSTTTSNQESTPISNVEITCGMPGELANIRRNDQERD